MPASDPAKTYCPNCRKFLDASEIFWSCWRPLTEDVMPSLTAAQQQANSSFDKTTSDFREYDEENKCCYTLNSNDETDCSNPKCEQPRDREESRDACRFCGSELPSFLQGLDPKTITVTGPSGAGKSHYIVALYDWWTNNLTSLGLSLFSCMGHRNEAIFENMRSDVVDHKTLLPRTNPGRMITFSWQILSPATYNQSGLLISLPDVAGERLYDVRALNENRHYRHAGGIIFLLDAERFSFGATASDKVRPASDHMRVANAMIQDLNSRLSLDEWRNIPVAVCLNKVDVLTETDPEWDGIINGIIPNHEQGFDLASCDARSDAIYAKLWEQKSSRPIVELMKNNFVQVKFFGIATIGSAVKEGAKQKVDLNPISVEDPFLWLLYAQGYISHA